MHPATLTLVERWRYALRPDPWARFLAPALFGQAIGVATVADASWLALALGVGFSGFTMAFAVLLKDWGNQEADALERRLFPEGSAPKTIPDRILDARSVAFAAVGAGAAAAGIGVAAQEVLQRPGLGMIAIMLLAIPVMHSVPPLRLNHRGAGELLEVLGVGLALPWFNATLQAGTLTAESWVLVPGFAILCLARAAGSGLANEESDRLAGKHTLATLLGPDVCRRAVELMLPLGIVAWALVPILARSWIAPTFIAPAAVVIGFHWREIRLLGSSASSGSYSARAAYRGHLDQAVTHGTLVLAVMLLLVVL